MDELNYRLPPDILHYEPKYFFGLGIQDLMIAVVPSILVLTYAGPITGAVAALLVLAGLKRFEGLGNRSALSYLFLWAWHKWRPEQVILPRVLPRQAARLEVETWEGETIYRLETEA